MFTPVSPVAEERLESLVSGRFASRLFAKDPTLWGEAAEPEASIRLGWTSFAVQARELVAATAALREELAGRGVSRVVLCGMGGSSLAPLVMAPDLNVLDSTHPDAVREALEGDLDRTVVVVSSKSGGTVETLSHRATFEAAFTARGIDPADRIVVVTDPGSALEASARDAGQRVFLADPNVGGRFSALTAFGIVPSVLSGADIAAIVDQAEAVRDELRTDSTENPALRLAAAISSALPEQYVLEVASDSTIAQGIGLWIEQLVAESTGKDGQGVLPIALGAATNASAAPAPIARRVVLSGEADAGAPDAITVAAPLGAQFLLWEVATAALGHLMGIDPFNQPDVEAAKAAARELLGAAGEPDATSNEPADSLSEESLTAEALTAELRALLPQNAYLAIQAFAYPRRSEAAELLEALRARLSAELGAPVSAAWGPRYLHSTGQLHKGGPATAAFLQLVELADEDLAIPGGTSTFGELIAAQSHGDAAVLRSRGRNVLTIVTRNLPELLRKLGF